MNRIILILGSNLGNRESNIETAILHIKNLGTITKQSSKLETIPIGYSSENLYINLGIEIYTSLSPIALLHKIKEIERNMGRIVDSSILNQYQDRIIDIDIVFYNNISYTSKTLMIPHIEHSQNRVFSKKILQQL